MTMKNVQIVDLGDIKVEVRELTVGEVRGLYNQTLPEEAVNDMVAAWLLPMSMHELAAMTSLTVADMDNLLPSQVEEVIEVCKQVNRHFFTMGDRMNKAADRAMKMLAVAPKPPEKD